MFSLRNLFFMLLTAMVITQVQASVYRISVDFDGRFDPSNSKIDELRKNFEAIDKVLQAFKKNAENYSDKEQDFAEKSRFWARRGGVYHIYTDATTNEIENALNNLKIKGLKVYFYTEVE